jgi:predicted methyltransferase
VTVQVQPTTTLTAPEPLDVVWTSDNYHDYNDKFMGRPGSLAFARSAFRILKPGGLFIVIDHSAAMGHGLADTETMHRIERAQVVREATAAGFRLAGQSDALLNRADPLNIPVFDPRIRFHTSQFALKFRKPAR